MARIAYVDGAYLPLRNAGISIEDRGFQFADAVYEVWGVRSGALLDEDAHFARLWRSLDELQIRAPMSEAALKMVVRETARRNRVTDGLIYLQISRGGAPRDHVFPAPHIAPTVVVTAKQLDHHAIDARAARGVRVITAPDNRWGRCDIKTVGLLPNVLARQMAKERGAFEAWLVDAAGFVTEGTSSNAWIVDRDGVLRTAPESANILRGVTRKTLLKLAAERQIRVEERSFTLEEARTAREAFLSSATNAAIPVIAIDGCAVGDGQPGPVAQKLRAAYFGGASN